MKNVIILFAGLFISLHSFGQEQEMEKVNDDEETSRGGFKKENLFTGGGIQLSFSSYNFGVGASPVFGYSINRWIDVGIGVNFNYISEREAYINSFGDEVATGNKIRQTTIGPIAFARVYPLKFLYIQAQGEHNFITQKYISGFGAPTEKVKFDATSLLVGIGYAGGREGIGNFFYHISVSIDVLKNKYSPYVQNALNGSTNILPILRAGIQVPLFQGGRRY